MVLNADGRKLIDFCIRTGFYILNGRCGDQQSSGCFTFMGDQGSSVTDYVLCNADNVEVCVDFTVISRVESDHLPVEFNIDLKLKRTCISSFDNSVSNSCVDVKFVWKDDKRN